MILPFLDFLAFRVAFDEMAKLRSYSYWKPPPICDIWWRFEVNCASNALSIRVLLNLWRVRTCFIGNWFEVVIIQISISIFCIPFFFFFFALFFFFLLFLIKIFFLFIFFKEINFCIIILLFRFFIYILIFNYFLLFIFYFVFLFFTIFYYQRWTSIDQ